MEHNDTDDHLTVDDLSNMTPVHKPTTSPDFYPYPIEVHSSLEIGLEWWSQQISGQL